MFVTVAPRATKIALFAKPAALGVEFVPPLKVTVFPAPKRVVPPVPFSETNSASIPSTLACVRAH